MCGNDGWARTDQQTDYRTSFCSGTFDHRLWTTPCRLFGHDIILGQSSFFHLFLLLMFADYLVLFTSNRRSREEKIRPAEYRCLFAQDSEKWRPGERRKMFHIDESLMNSLDTWFITYHLHHLSLDNSSLLVDLSLTIRQRKDPTVTLISADY